MMEYLDGDVAMNLVGLILIAALSGGIVAVSLRLRASASASSARMWIEGDHLPAEDWHRPAQSARRREAWLQDPLGLKSKSGIYRVVKDLIGS